MSNKDRQIKELVDRLRNIFYGSDYGHLCQHECNEAADAIESLQAKVEERQVSNDAMFRDSVRLSKEVDHLNAVLDKISKRIEKIAFDIPPPNQHTPNLIILVNEIRHEYARNRGESDEA